MRMHEAIVLPSVFGCQADDTIAHYVVCPALRAIVFEAFGGIPGSSPLNILAALSLQPCTDRQIVILYLSHTLYHAQKYYVLDNPSLLSDTAITLHALRRTYLTDLARACIRQFEGKFDLHAVLRAIG